MRSLICLSLVLILFGCADTKDPAGPENGIPYFDVVVTPSLAAPYENVVLSLLPILPLEFENIEGELVCFSGVPDSGRFFDFSASYIDLNASGNLSPPVWYQYLGKGSPDTAEVRLYAHVLGESGDTLAWNYAILEVVAVR